jgi:hypothetical protein
MPVMAYQPDSEPQSATVTGTVTAVTVMIFPYLDLDPGPGPPAARRSEVPVYSLRIIRESVT